jgi:nucleoside-diphosphate-sugar epimerase
MSNAPAISASPVRTIAVTGASGFVGRYIIRELLGRGYAVRALVRDMHKAREAFGVDLGRIEPVVGDVCDDATLAKLLRTSAGNPVEACIHLVGIIREVRGDTTDLPQTFQRMHVSATRHVVDACRGAGVKRYLHMSALGVGPEGKAEYQKTKWEAERYVRRAFGDGTELDWTIFRPSLIHGPDGEFVRMMADLCSGEVPPYFFLPYFAKKHVDDRVPGGAVSWTAPSVQPVAVEDVARSFVEALERRVAIGEIYNLVGPYPMTWPTMLEIFRDTLPTANKKLKPFFVPGEHGAIIATVASTLGLGRLLPFDKGQAIMGAEDTVGDPTKAKTDLGVAPRPFRETLRKYARAV